MSTSLMFLGQLISESRGGGDSNNSYCSAHYQRVP